MLKDDGSYDHIAWVPSKEESGKGDLVGLDFDKYGNIYVSEIMRNQIWVLSPDGLKRILIANKMNAPLDNNTSLVLKEDVLCTANLGYLHAKPEQADRTVVCMKGFSVPK